MAERFDVTARLAEGREAVQHTETYVAACRSRGYQHPDLTAHTAQVHDWYDGDDGMELRLLDGDCTELWTLVNTAEEALRVQRTQLGELEAAWRGPGCDAATEFLRGHCEAGAALVDRLRAAVDACGMLRDDLWRLVDGKVTAAVDIDDRACAARSEWLAAAHTVAAGTGDTDLAGNVIDHQVRPYVDNDIRADWVGAMRSARTSVAAAYQTAAAAATPGSGGVFPVPDELGPRYRLDGPVSPVWPAAVVPAVAAAPPGSPADLPAGRSPVDLPADRSPVDSVPDPSPPHDDPPDVPLDDLADWPSDTGLRGGGLPGGFGLPGGTGSLGGLGGLVPRIADAIGSLLGASDGGPEEPWPDDPLDTSEVDDDDPLDNVGPGESEGTEPAADEAEESEPETPVTEVAEDSPATDDASGDAAGDAAGGGAAPADQPIVTPPAAVPDAVAGGDGKTPCEIAADELPQVGAGR